MLRDGLEDGGRTLRDREKKKEVRREIRRRILKKRQEPTIPNSFAKKPRHYAIPIEKEKKTNAKFRMIILLSSSFPSMGSPMTFMMRPRVALPTGTCRKNTEV